MGSSALLLETLAGLSILVVGESHLALPLNLVNPLVDDLTSRGASVHSVGVCGAGASDWLKPVQVSCAGERRSNAQGTYQFYGATTIPIMDLVKADKPDVIVVIVGDAAVANKTLPTSWVWQTTTDLAKAIASTKTTCVWVGPPWGEESGLYSKANQRVEYISNFLARNVSPCVYVDSLKFSRPGEWKTNDGQHFNKDGYKSWSAAIVKALTEIPAIGKLKPQTKVASR